MAFNMTDDLLNQMRFERHNSIITDIQFYEYEINRFLSSQKYKDMLTAEKYYKGDQDILYNGRKEINGDGELVNVENAIDNRIIDNRYAELVDQKSNYFVGSPFVISSKNEMFTKTLDKIFDKGFKRTLKAGTKNGINSGIFYIMPFYDQDGEFQFKYLKGCEVIPFWRDAEHTILDQAIRIIPSEHYKTGRIEVVIHIEIMRADGVLKYILVDGKLKPEIEFMEDKFDKDNSEKLEPYFRYRGLNGSWGKIPLVAFKPNPYEIPLINRVKSLQDAINRILSMFQNHMEEDYRSTILVLVNYDGTDLNEFRRNLSAYGAIKIRSVDGVNGKVETLTVEVNSQNYNDILGVLNQAIVRNGRGYDANDSRLQGNPNQMNIQSMYTNIDLDADDMEMEYKASFEQLGYFIERHLKLTGSEIGFEDFEVTFKRDMLMVESDIISNIMASRGLVSDKTLRAVHPYVTDESEEEKRLDEENSDNMMDFYNKTFPLEHIKGNSNGLLE